MCTNHQPLYHARQLMILSLALVSLAACSGGEDRISLDPGENIHEALDSAAGPLEDLNLRRAEIPEQLKTIMGNPYAEPVKIECDVIKAELTTLEDLLGPDMEPTTVELSEDDSITGQPDKIRKMNIPDSATLVNKGAHFAKETLMGAIRSHTNIIPFRSIVRTITGANAYDKKVERAYQAGQLRRAYLKGLAQANFGKRCLAPPLVVEARVTEPAH